MKGVANWYPQPLVGNTQIKYFAYYMRNQLTKSMVGSFLENAKNTRGIRIREKLKPQELYKERGTKLNNIDFIVTFTGRQTTSISLC